MMSLSDPGDAVHGVSREMDGSWCGKKQWRYGSKDG
jgi:hypothetical protein